MRSRIAVALALVSLIVLSAAPQASATSDRELPIRGMTTVNSEIYSDPTCEGGSWDILRTGWGEVAHLGRVALEQQHCTIFDYETGIGVVNDSHMVLTAANGDELALILDATFYTEVTDEGFFGYITATWEVDGASSTGRFFGATGSGTWNEVGDIDMTLAHAAFVGVIDYDPSQ